MNHFASTFYNICAGLLLMLSPSASLLYAQLPFPTHQVSQYVVRKWSVADGLPSPSVHRVIQTRDTYLWLATNSGFARFDGIHFTVFNTSTTPELDVDGILSLCEDHDGNLWIGTRGSGLLRRSPDGNFRRFTQSDGLASNTITALCLQNRNTLWIASDKGLQSLHVPVKQPNLELTTLKFFQGRYVTKLFCDRQQRIWGNQRNNGVFSVQNNNISEFQGYRFLEGDFTQLQDGQVLYGDVDNGLLRYDSTEHRLVEYRPFGIQCSSIDALHCDQNGTLWIAGIEGLRSITSRGITSILKDNRFDNTFDMINDHEGNLWIGSGNGGLLCLKRGQWTPLRESEGLVHSIIHSVRMIDDSVLYVGTQKGLMRLQHGKTALFNQLNSHLPNNLVRDICTDHNGTVWIATHGGIALQRGSRWSKITHHDGLPDNIIRKLLFDRHHNVWVGSRTGLTKYRIQKNSQHPEKVFFYQSAPHQILDLREDSTGLIWAATEGAGVLVFHPTTGEIVRRITTQDGLPSNTVFQTYQSPDGKRWFLTNNGISRLHNEQLRSLTQKSGLPINALYQMIHDKQGNFWFTSDQGILFLDYLHLEYKFDTPGAALPHKIFTVGDGLPNNSSMPCSRITSHSSGLLLFPTAGGLAMINPEITRNVSMPPPVFIESVSGDSLNHTIKHNNVEFLSTQQMISFSYTAIHYADANSLLFRYRLEGYDEHWINAGARRTAYYTNLPPGNYVFRVLARNSDGVWNNEGKSLMVIIHPAWWQTIWFYCSSAFAALIVLFIVYRTRVHQLKKRTEELGKLVSERTKELIDANNQLSAAKYEIERQMEVQTEQAREIELANTSLQEQHKRIEDAYATLRSTQIQLIHAEKMSGLGQLTAGVAHEINNPINFISSAIPPLRNHFTQIIRLLQMYEEFESSPQNHQQLINTVRTLKQEIEFQETLDEISLLLKSVESGAERITGITKGLRIFSRLDEDVLKPSDIHEGLNSTLMLLPNQHPHSITIHRDYGDLPPVDCIPGQLNQVFMNVLINAIQAIPRSRQDGVIRIRTRREQDHIKISISDNGIGMDTATRRRIFEPFFTTKDVGQGTGLGLSIAYGIMEKHHGSISVESEQGCGSTFIVALPVHGLNANNIL